MTNHDFQLLKTEADRHQIGNRTPSTALLAWFLETVWRMEPEDVSDSICDGGGDKGIDALEVNEDLREITVFQSKRRESATGTQGDLELRAFVGVSGYFADEHGIDSLLASSPNAELRNLIERLELRKKLAEPNYAVRLVFVTNGLLDSAGVDFVASRANHAPTLDVWDRARLVPVAERTKGLEVQPDPVTLRLASDLIDEPLEQGTRIAVALVSALDLVQLPGIDNLSIFELNVRLGLGRTRINRELAATIDQASEHSIFPAYHNGLTVLTRGIDVNGRSLRLNGISVVNGCQSLLALYNNRDKLTDDLRVLIKLVELRDSLGLADLITYRTNNQNGVNARDLRSTDRIQRDLQSEVQNHYGDDLAYVIRAGEQATAPNKLDNTAAAQLIMAVLLGEPWNAVGKVKLFDQEYHRVFSREINGHKLYLLHILNEIVSSKREGLRADLEASFAAARFTLLHLLVTLVRTTERGEVFLTNPERWLPSKLEDVRSSLDELADDVVESLNFYIETREEDASEEGTLFDPKTVFKSRAGVQPLVQDVTAQARRTARRDSGYGFNVSPVAR